MKDRRVIELTFHWSPNFSIETMINLKETRLWIRDRTAGELTRQRLPNVPITAITDLGREQGFE
jgi:hypothetical protein